MTAFNEMTGEDAKKWTAFWNEVEQVRSHIQALNTTKAEQYKIEQTKIGEGDAARRNAVMVADGALSQKIDAWLSAQNVWASAFAKYQGDIVPRIVTGSTTTMGGGTQSANAATGFMELMGMKAANDLSLDMRIAAPAKSPVKN